ncbi:hypothetical protein [Sporomusa sp.]|uniref:hypothetical protein n=1 Tax=Sporomusa sp. TaxID=2078658 RepID=UPI002B5FEF09|nr:hypothetical protein [Sporomusa sp.]HWR07785.1 hypothetical protein [Sporomusa sp.]
MELIEVVRQEMGVWGITAKELARRICVAPNTVSTWFNRGCIPESMEGRVTGAIDSPRLSEERCSRCEGNTFPTRYLDNVDEHPMVAINKAGEEIDEWLPLAKQVHMIITNKRRGTKFSAEEEAVLIHFENETADIITSMKTVLIRFQECYNRPVRETMERHVNKLEESGYCSEIKEKSPVLAHRR